MVEASANSERSGAALVGLDHRQQNLPLLKMAEVSDPVMAAGGGGGDVPLHRGVATAIRTLQPMKPAVRERHAHQAGDTPIRLETRPSG